MNRTNTSIENDILRVFRLQQANQKRLRESTASDRIEKLGRLLNAVETRADELKQALFEDLRKPEAEVLLTEIYPVIAEIKHARRHLKRWLRPRSVPAPLALLGSRSEIRYAPKGVVLVISPWNFPFQLALSPLVSAIAAGNAVILKPSWLSPETSAFIRNLMGELFEESEVAVFEGDHRVGEFLAQQPFDHIFFTGSPEVGRRVMAAAAANLTSVTLELGGKSPVIVDPSADIDEVATKVLWGKTVNAGQSCVAPDYVLVPKNLEARFIELARDSLEKRFGSLDRLAENPDFGRIINKGHFQRIKHLVDDAIEGGARIEMGGRFREDNRFISPTVLTHVPPAAAVLQEEIFGPVLPIVTYESREDALRFVNERPTPLALYVFGKSKPAVEAILKETGAGGTMVNDDVVHFANPYLPFGGLKESGIGKARGVSGFKAFSNERPVMHQRKWTLTQLLYPPYTRSSSGSRYATFSGTLFCTERASRVRVGLKRHPAPSVVAACRIVVHRDSGLS